VVAKGKKHKNKKPKKQKKSRKRNIEQPAIPTPTPVTRITRGQVTQTFTSDNASSLLVPAGAPGTTKGNANPYPAVITVSGFANGAITDVDLVLQDLSHPVPEDIDILLVAPDGRRALVMSDVGRIFRVTNIDLTLDDEAAIPLPQTELDSGDYRPTEISPIGQPPDEFPAPAPALDGSVALSTFDGADPNGTWQLFIVDDASGDAGDIRGWALRITAEVDTGTITE
jgi:subtilisin-like proprotein convertase family protein